MNKSFTAITAWLDQGCERSARYFVDTHRQLVRRVVARRLPSAHMIEDVVQETFVRAFSSMHRLVPGGNVAAWLCTIARNTSVNYLRGRRRNIVKSATDCGIDDYTELLVYYDRVEGEDEEIVRSIEALLSHLKQPDRLLLGMIHLENRSAREVGRILGITEGNVRIRLMRSLRALRSYAVAMRANGCL